MHSILLAEYRKQIWSFLVFRLLLLASCVELETLT